MQYVAKTQNLTEVHILEIYIGMPSEDFRIDFALQNQEKATAFVAYARIH